MSCQFHIASPTILINNEQRDHFTVSSRTPILIKILNCYPPDRCNCQSLWMNQSDMSRVSTLFIYDRLLKSETIFYRYKLLTLSWLLSIGRISSTACTFIIRRVVLPNTPWCNHLFPIATTIRRWQRRRRRAIKAGQSHVSHFEEVLTGDRLSGKYWFKSITRAERLCVAERCQSPFGCL